MVTSRLPTCRRSCPGPWPRTSADGEKTRKNSKGNRKRRPSLNATSNTREAERTVISVGIGEFGLVPLVWVPICTPVSLIPGESTGASIARSPHPHAVPRGCGKAQGRRWSARCCAYDDAMSTEVSTIDPVCGMTVNPDRAAARADYQGRTYYFCCKHCLAKFQAN